MCACLGVLLSFTSLLLLRGPKPLRLFVKRYSTVHTTHTDLLCTGSHGLPFLGHVLDAAATDFEMAKLFEKLGSNAFNLNLGPTGWYLALQTAEDMDEISVKKAKNVYPKWPSAFAAPLLGLFLYPSRVCM